MVNWLIPIIIDNVLGYVLDQSSIGERIRGKFEKDVIDIAFERALQKTFSHFETNYSYLARNQRFRESFQTDKFSPVFIKLLQREKVHDVNALAELWADTLYSRDTQEHESSKQSLTPIATLFLKELDDNLGKEQILGEIRDSQVFEAISNHINTLVDHFVRSPLSEAEIKEQKNQYCKKLCEQWSKLDFKGIQHIDPNRSVIIPLTDVFVFPDVHFGIPEYETVERGDDQKEAQAKKQIKNSAKELAEQIKRRQFKKEIPKREDIRLPLISNSRLVILGDPGSGKSTLLKYLTLLSAERSEVFQKEFPQPLGALGAMIPIYIPLSAYAETWLLHNISERSLQDFLPIYLKSIYLSPFSQLIQTLLEQGKLLILLDGLDEIPDASLRMQIVRL